MSFNTALFLEQDLRKKVSIFKTAKLLLVFVCSKSHILWEHPTNSFVTEHIQCEIRKVKKINNGIVFFLGTTVHTTIKVTKKHENSSF